MNKHTEESIPHNEAKVLSDLKFPIVGIGASAGGLPTICKVLENLPPGNGMAFVVVLHLSPNHDSNADQVLQRVTKMPVVKVNDTTHIEKEHVYVIAPHSQLSMNDGYLCITHFDRPLGKHVAIDNFFRDLANVHRERAVAVVLSGTGSDGAVGIAAIKEQGGVTVAQAPSDAEHDGMPIAAIETGFIDFVLPAVEIPQKLIDLWSNARQMQLPVVGESEAGTVQQESPRPDKEGSEELLRHILSQLFNQTGHDFRHYKRATVLRRLERRMQVCAVPTLQDYRVHLEKDPTEFQSLLKDMLIGVTNFFRDREAFETLERDIVSELFRETMNEVRVWVPACATGEEAYSIAMLLTDFASRLPAPPPIKIFASDIDDRAINMARRGLYPLSITTDVSPTRLRQFFSKHEHNYKIRKTIRDKVLFASHNLLRDPPFSKLNLISCRNLLIYLTKEIQLQVLEMFHFALQPDGILFLGSSESADVISDFFTPIDKKHRIYRAKPSIRASRYLSPVAARMAPKLANIPTMKERPFSHKELHERALLKFGPASILVDPELNIIHVSDTASVYLRLKGGELSQNLLSLILPELRLEFRTAVYQVQQYRSPIAKHVAFSRDSQRIDLLVSIQPCQEEGSESELLLIVIEETPQLKGDDHTSLLGENFIVNQLEAELQRSKELLQNTIEHAEVSNEEFRAVNEELQAINEELRSTTEELETSKEEMQSVNEELVTVNYELKVKVEETGKANDDLNNLIIATDIATIFIDNALRIKRYTPRAAGIFSIIPTDVGRSLLDLAHTLEYDDLETDAATSFASLRQVEREVRSLDGRFFIVRVHPYRTTDDKIDGAVLTFFDITKRKEAEDRAHAIEENMRLVAESTSDFAIIILDVNGFIVSWNGAAESMFEYREQEILGQPVDILFTESDRSNGLPQDEMRRAARDGRAEDERWHLKKDGSRFYCSGVTTPLRNNGLYGYAKITRDQTIRKQQDVQKDLALTSEKKGRWNAEAASALKDEFLAIMSHELRHPLNTIQIHAELLARSPAIQNSPANRKAMSTIRSSVVSQAKIIEDLLDMSRVNTGKLSILAAEIDLQVLLQEIVNTLHADAATAGLTLYLEGTSCVVNADAVRIEQVTLNLLSNAMKFTPSGGTIRVVLTSDEAEARLDVIDDGQGISRENLPLVFDMFGQAGAVKNRSKRGLGIGLALVQQIAHLHQGRVEAFSDGLGKGSRFTMWLPLAKSSRLASVPAPFSLEESVSGMTILIVDDAEDMISAFKDLLELDGATVFIAESAKEGLHILAEQKIDLIISDISMPDMNGYEFIETVLKTNPTIPSIAISGLTREQDKNRSYQAGFSSHLTKPLSLEKLGNAILKLLNPG